MELVLVERRFVQPVKYEDIESLEVAGAQCLKTFLSRDRRRMLSLYQAPDAQSVKFPFNSAWTCTHLKSGKASAKNSDAEYVIVERMFPEVVTADFISNAVRQSGWCLDLHNAEYVESFLGNDGHRMVCLFRAPDAEAVRRANQQGGWPYTEVWTASVHS